MTFQIQRVEQIESLVVQYRTQGTHFGNFTI